MIHPFSELGPEYDALFARMQMTHTAEIESVSRRLLKTIHHFDDVSKATGVPIVWGAASFEREASSNFRLSPAQGDPWDRKSVHVPRGRGPFPSWEASAIDAYQLDHLDRVGAENWTTARALYEGELFNGFGYRGHGIHSPYLWAGTNIYTCGKYVADSQWSSGAVDQQLGIVPMMVAMMRMEPSLAFFPARDAAPVVETPAPVPAPAPAPAAVGGEHHNVRWMQHVLNYAHLGVELNEDGNFGRRTRAAVRAFQSTQSGLVVDGLYGPKTKAALEAMFPE